MAGDRQTWIYRGLTAVGIVLLVLIYFAPIWWVSLTAPNYPAEAFPDGVRIHFHANGVFNGCRKIEKTEITEVEALDVLAGVDAVHISSGGVGGAEGAVWLALYGEKEQLDKAQQVIDSVRGEPPFTDV